VFNQLRNQRNVEYFQAFIQFQQHKKKEILFQSLNQLIKREDDVRLPVLKAPSSQARHESDNIRDAFVKALKEVRNVHASSALKQSFSKGSESAVY
jgi:ElaB/YqjD/DUF883 family membrane-anchored ribosome-binding protein